MDIYDVIMMVVLAGATIIGAWKGMAWQIASLASIFLSYFVAYEFRGTLAGMIDAAPPWNIFLSMLIIYVVCSLVIWVIFRMVAEFIDRLKLKEFDHQLGALIGAAKGVVLCVLITLFAVTLLNEPEARRVIDSRSGYYIAMLLNRAHPLWPAELHDTLEPYIHSLDERLDDKDEHYHVHDARNVVPAAVPGITPTAGDSTEQPVSAGAQSGAGEETPSGGQGWIEFNPG